MRDRTESCIKTSSFRSFSHAMVQLPVVPTGCPLSGSALDCEMAHRNLVVAGRGPNEGRMGFVFLFSALRHCSSSNKISILIGAV